MQDKKDFTKVIIIGMTVVSFILISFPIIAYFAYQSTTGEVSSNKLDNSSKSSNE